MYFCTWQRCVPTMVGRAAKKILRSRQPFLIGKWPRTRRHTACRRTAEFASRTCCLPFYVHFQNGGSNAAQGAQTKCKSICTTKLVDSAKTAEPKMAFNFAHLLSAACGGAPRRLGRLRRPPGRWQHSVYSCGCARYTTGALWRAPGEHDYAVVASTRERVASIFTKTLGVPSAASIRSDVTVPGAPGGTA